MPEHRDQKDLIYDDGSIRPFPPDRQPDADAVEALEPTHEPRTVDGHDIYVPREIDEDDGD